MASCAVNGCPITFNNRPGSVTLHGFPKVAEMKQKWLNAIQTNTEINTMSAVCSMHFDNVSKCVIGDTKTRLLHRAVPSINLTEEEASRLIPGPLRMSHPKPNVPSTALPTEICRVCLKSESPLSPLFDDIVDEQNCLASKLMLATDLNISTWDDRPQGICVECQRLVEATLTVRQLCKSSDAFLEEEEQRIVNLKGEEHTTSMNIKFVCDQCGWTFSTPAALRTHEYDSHTGERPYACNKCPKKFAVQKSLKLHQMKHNTERSCICEECGLGFTTASILKTHSRTHNVKKHTHEKAYSHASELN